METSALKQPAVHDCSHLKYTNTLKRQAPWSFVVMPVHGGESTLEGKDCLHAYNRNSTFNVISDAGMHVVLQSLSFDPEKCINWFIQSIFRHTHNVKTQTEMHKCRQTHILSPDVFFFALLQDSTTVTPVTLTVDPKGYFLYWTDQNKVRRCTTTRLFWTHRAT